MLAAGSRGNCQALTLSQNILKGRYKYKIIWIFGCPFVWTNEERRRETQLCFLNFYSKHVQMDLGVKKASDFNDFPER